RARRDLAADRVRQPLGFRSRATDAGGARAGLIALIVRPRIPLRCIRATGPLLLLLLLLPLILILTFGAPPKRRSRRTRPRRGAAQGCAALSAGPGWPFRKSRRLRGPDAQRRAR